MKKYIMFLAVSLSTVGWAEDLAVKIGLVDMNYALQNVDEGKKAKSNFEKEINSKKKEIQDEENAIKKLGEEFRKQSLVMTEEARGKKQGELQERVVKLQEKGEKTRIDLQGREAELTAPIVKKIREIISRIAKEKKYTLVLQRNEDIIFYSEPKDDLTEEVIKLINTKK